MRAVDFAAKLNQDEVDQSPGWVQAVLLRERARPVMIGAATPGSVICSSDGFAPSSPAFFNPAAGPSAAVQKRAADERASAAASMISRRPIVAVIAQ